MLLAFCAEGFALQCYLLQQQTHIHSSKWDSHNSFCLAVYVGIIIVYSFSQNNIGCEYYCAFFLVSVSKKEKGGLNGTIDTHVCRFTSAK